MVKQCHKLLEVLILSTHSAGEFYTYKFFSIFFCIYFYIFLYIFKYSLKNNIILIYRVSSSSPSSTPTDACATSSEQEDEPPPPPISARPERTKSIVSNFCIKKIILFIF